MRAISIVLAVLFCAAVVRAETLEGLSRRIDDIVLGRNNGAQIQDLRVQDDATIGDDLAVSGDLAVTGSATVASKSVAVSPSSTKLMVDRGTCTNGQATVTFGVNFGVAPSVVLTWRDAVSAAPAAGTNLTLSASSVTVSNFAPKVAALVVGGPYTNISWVAIGTAP